jgi:2'-5' RNA ligase
MTVRLKPDTTPAVRLKPDTTSMVTAIDIAVLLPADVSARAVALSAALPASESQGLLLGAKNLPHITLTQQFVPADRLDALIARVDAVLRRHAALRLHVTGGGTGSGSVSMAVERTASLVSLHERLLDAAEGLETGSGDASAFVAGDARERDVRWVREFRRESSFDRFVPHITLGHASTPPQVEPMEFTATTIAVCHLGRFCTCRRVIRVWEL